MDNSQSTADSNFFNTIHNLVSNGNTLVAFVSLILYSRSAVETQAEPESEAPQSTSALVPLFN